MKETSQWSIEEGDFFEGLEAAKKAFFSRAKRMAVSKNTMIFFEEDPSTSCYYLEKGIVRIFKISYSGKEPIFFIRRHGAMFGLAEVLDSIPRKSNAQTLSESVIWEIGRKDFESMISDYPDFSRRILSCMGRRIRYLGDQVESLMTCDVVTRLAKLIVYLAYENMSQEEDWERPVTIQKKLTQEQMASMTGSCQQTVSNTLKRFQEEGLIQRTKKGLKITNPLQLIRKAEH